jgi:hypothetical protein
VSRLASLAGLLLILVAVAPRTASAQASPGAPDDVPGEAPLRPFTPHRADTILLESVVRPEAWWIQAALGGAVYDARRSVVIGRVSPGLQAGRRFNFWGVFVTAELDHVFDFTFDTRRLDVLNLGVGGEFLNFMGHVRSTLAAGASVLLSRTSIDEPGEVGWFVDFRPGALRWGIGDAWAFELSPLSVDVIVPVTEGIPLIVLSFMTTLSVEWSVQ